MPYNTMLEEVCKASTMKAATALSRFLHIPIKIDIKPVEINSIDKITLPNLAYKHSIGLFVSINGHVLKGGSSLILPETAAFTICDLLLDRPEGSTEKMDETEESALKELMNIVVGNFLTTFAHSLLSAALMHSPASIEINDTLDVIKHLRSLLADAVGKKKAINISFSYQHEKLQGTFNIVFESDKILSLLNQVMVLSNG